MEKNEDALLKLGRRLTELRQKQRFSVDELASRAGLAPDVIIAIEAGKIDPPLTTLISLCKALGLPPDQVVNDL